MKFKMNKATLKSSIAIASKALSKNVILVERSHLLFVVSGDKVSISGTNNDLKAHIEIGVIDNEAEDQFSFTADPKMLDKLLAKIEYDDIQFDFDPEEYILTVYTTEKGTSFNTLQSFPTTKMLTVDGLNETSEKEYKISTSILKKALSYCQVFLEMKEENKRYDFLVLNKGIAFGSNGMNRMGYFIAEALKPIVNLKIRKIAVALFSNVLGKITDSEVILAEQGNNIVMYTADRRIYFGCLKSSVESPKMHLDLVKGGGPYITVNRTELNNKLKRLFATKASIVGSGIKLELSGAGEDSKLTLSLLANLKAKEVLNCSRIDDDSPDNIEKLIDCKMLQTIIAPFEEENLNIFMENTFRVIETIDSDLGKYRKVGIGSYSRLVKQ